MLTRIKNYILNHEQGIDRKALILFAISTLSLSVLTFLFFNKEAMEPTDYQNIFATFNLLFQAPLVIAIHMKIILWLAKTEKGATT